MIEKGKELMSHRSELFIRDRVYRMAAPIYAVKQLQLTWKMQKYIKLSKWAVYPYDMYILIVSTISSSALHLKKAQT